MGLNGTPAVDNAPVTARGSQHDDSPVSEIVNPARADRMVHRHAGRHAEQTVGPFVDLYPENCAIRRSGGI